MVVRLNIEIWIIGKGGTNKGGQEKGPVGGGNSMGAAGFCGPCECFGVFLLL
jgi:hypothetical protein